MSWRRSLKKVQDPVVTIVIQSFVGPTSEQVRVVGQAAKPAALNYKQDMTVLDVMIAVAANLPRAIAPCSCARPKNKAYNVRRAPSRATSARNVDAARRRHHHPEKLVLSALRSIALRRRMKEILHQPRRLLRVLWAYRWWGLGAAALAVPSARRW